MTSAPKTRVFDYSHLIAYDLLRANGPEVALFDLDGTLCLRRPDGRGPYDEDRVGEDLPNTPVVRTLCALAVAGIQPVFMSGRRETCRPDTEEWLRRHIPVKWLGLHMRAADDRQRADYLVKYDLFNTYIRHRFRVVMVFDDRGQVVGMWRAIGLPVFQVAPSPD